MFVWTSGFQKSLAHSDFNMFVDEWMSASKSLAVNATLMVTVTEMGTETVCTNIIEYYLQANKLLGLQAPQCVL